jgi:hypothetical protein
MMTALAQCLAGLSLTLAAYCMTRFWRQIRQAVIRQGEPGRAQAAAEATMALSAELDSQLADAQEVIRGR